MSPACLWDRDTLAQESKEAPGTVEILTGRFERFPPPYYTIRLERLITQILTDPGNLDLYDDAGVACDRLGKSAEAIDWMRRKKAVLDGLAIENRDHLYRYHANLGTFLVHQWLKNGADLANRTLVKESKRHIKTAIEINPDAHFGREKFQLMALDWLLAIPSQDGRALTFLHMANPEGYIEKGWGNENDAIKGISGLVRLGNGWKSVDVFESLAAALDAGGHASLVKLAMLRIDKLKKAGITSLDSANTEEPIFHSMLENPEPIHRYYAKARKEADAWQTARWEYMEAQFERDLHPDMAPDFWKEFIYKAKPPRLPNSTGMKANLFHFLPLVTLIAICASLFLFLTRLLKR